MSDKTRKELWKTLLSWEKAVWKQKLRLQAKAFGIDFEALYTQLEIQLFKCPICSRPLTRAHVDIGDDGALRGLLCGRCFAFMRKIADDPLRAVVRKRDRMRRARAFAYLHSGRLNSASP